MKQLQKNNSHVIPEKYLVDDKWLSTKMFVNQLNKYYTDVGGKPLETDCAIPVKDIEQSFSIA